MILGIQTIIFFSQEPGVLIPGPVLFMAEIRFTCDYCPVS